MGNNTGFNTVPPVKAASSATFSATFASPNTGPGDTLTGLSGAALVVDGYTAVKGDRLLLMGQATSYTVATATVVNGGTTATYVVGDTLTVSGGTFVTAATLTVTAVSAGSITAVNVLNHGYYTVEPTNPVATTGGTGAGATFNLTWNTSVAGGAQDGVYMLTTSPIAGEVATFGTITQPTGGTIKNGTYAGYTQASTSGTGTGAVAVITVTGNTVTSVAFSDFGSGYAVNDTLTFNANGDGFGNGLVVTVNSVYTGAFAGGIATWTITTQPSTDLVYNGYYWNFPLTGGTGSGATANIVISGGVVTSITLVNPGSGYAATDTLGFSGSPTDPSTVGLGTGGTVVVATITDTPWVLTRTADAAFGNQLEGLLVWVMGGSTNANTAWVQKNQTVTIDTTVLSFVELVA